MKHIWLWLGLTLIVAPMSAQDKSQEQGRRKKKKGQVAAPAPKKEEDKFGDIIKKCSKAEGLIVLYRDTLTGKTYMELNADQLGKEFIYFSHVLDSPVEAGHHRGSFGESKVVRVEKVYDRIVFTQVNTNFYYNPANPLSRSKEANINDPILASEKVEAVSLDKKRFLVDGDAIFLSEKMRIVKWPGSGPSVLGNLSKEKTRVQKFNNYPENTEVQVMYVYENGNPPTNSSALEDPRNVSVKIQHSFLSMPAAGFEPRGDDPRIGYFTTQISDMTTFETVNYRDVIHRWRLEKKDPSLLISEPVKPITFWIENTTPYEWRPMIKEACERWNIAFEKAGFKNAVVCLEQPDDATWDAGDIRYNVLRWTSTPEPPYGGYGPSFVDPRTGEILGADIMLEFVAIINRVNAENFFKSGFLSEEDLSAMHEMNSRNPFLCSASKMSEHQAAFGEAAVEAFGMGDAMKKEVARQLLYRLILHEVGHTLGLTHNMRASTLQSPKDIKNIEKIKKEGLANSIMEYPAFNYQLNPAEQAAYCDEFVGPYDWWVIEYGYSAPLANEEDEHKRLLRIAARSTEHALAYGNDADDMRSPGHGIDPDVNIFDLSNDPVAYAVERCELVNVILPKLKDKVVGDNESYQEYVKAFGTVTGEYASQLSIMTRQMAGVHYDRAFVGQDGAKLPLEPVSKEKQKAAMEALRKYAFAPHAFDSWEVGYHYLLKQRRGFSHFSDNDDPNIHERVLNIQRAVLAHLVHPTVIQRFSDTRLYGNTYTLDAYLMDLTDAIFKEDLNDDVNTFRQNVQVEYVNRLIKALQDPKSEMDQVGRGMIVFELKRIANWMKATSSGDTLTQAHRQHVWWLIDQALNKN